MSRLTRDGTAEPLLRDQILRRERGQGKKILIFPVQLTTCRNGNLTYPVDPYSCCMCDHTDIHGMLSARELSAASLALFFTS